MIGLLCDTGHSELWIVSGYWQWPKCGFDADASRWEHSFSLQPTSEGLQPTSEGRNRFEAELNCAVQGICLFG